MTMYLLRLLLRPYELSCLTGRWLAATTNPPGIVVAEGCKHNNYIYFTIYIFLQGNIRNYFGDICYSLANAFWTSHIYKRSLLWLCKCKSCCVCCCGLMNLVDAAAATNPPGIVVAERCKHIIITYILPYIFLQGNIRSNFGWHLL